MFNLNPEPLFPLSSEPASHPRTPTLPSIPEASPHKGRHRSKHLNIITANLTSLASPIIKTASNRVSIGPEVPVRRNLFSEFVSEEVKSRKSESPRKKSMRSLSTSSNDKGKYFLYEISTLNNKIRNLIKEQETMRDKLVVQETFIQGLQRDRQGFCEVQSATIPECEFVDDCYFNVTFKPQDKWLPRSRKFPREVFSRPIKNK